MSCPIGKWKHGPNPTVCPSCLILSHTHKLAAEGTESQLLPSKMGVFSRVHPFEQLVATLPQWMTIRKPRFDSQFEGHLLEIGVCFQLFRQTRRWLVLVGIPNWVYVFKGDPQNTGILTFRSTFKTQLCLFCDGTLFGEFVIYCLRRYAIWA